MKIGKVIVLILSAILCASCVTAGPGTGGQPATGNGPQTASVEVRSAAETEPPNNEPSDAESVREMKTFMANAEAAVSAGKYSEGIRNYVSVLADGKQQGATGTEARELIDRAGAELERIGNALSLQPQSHWIDEAGLQKEGSSLSAGKDPLQNPGVVLTITSGAGKYIIADAPIRFSFVKGSGKIVETVSTDEYGLANSSILSFTNGAEESVIRATVEYRVSGFTWTFDRVFRDFAYLPPSRTAIIIATERSELGMEANPLILDDTYLILKDIRMDFSPYNAVLIGPEFEALFNGDTRAVERVANDAKVSYLVVVMVDCYDVRKMVVNGKEYNMFSSFATATLRIIRSSDKRIVYSLPVEKIRGQGLTKEAAVQDAYKRAREEFTGRLRAKLPEVEQVVDGSV